jgi:catechol 2,3-dioxygenase-like lactoylglutathione lyase family enzyme
MARIDHVAVESPNPEAAAAFYECVLGARIVRTEEHPVAAYLGNTGFAIHAEGRARPHTGIRVSEQERAAIKERLDAEGIASVERDHGLAVGLFFEDPDGRLLEAITYSGVAYPRMPSSSSP